MRIAYLSADFGVPIHGTKGASIHVREMVRGLSEAGHRVAVFSPALVEAGASRSTPIGADREALADAEGSRGDGPPGSRAAVTRDPERMPSGGSVEFVALPPEPRHIELLEEIQSIEDRAGIKSRLRQELRNLLYNVPFLERLRAHLAAHPVDFIYERYALFAHAGEALARELGVPHLLEVNAPLAEEQERTRGLLLKELARESERRVLEGSDAVIVVSRRLAEFAVGCGVAVERVHVLPNAVDPRRFTGPAVPGPLPGPLAARLSGRNVIGFVGTLKPWHGIETLIDAFALLRARHERAHLLIVGDGPGRAALVDQVARHGLEDAVTFTGAVAHDEIPGHLAAMDVAVAPGTPSENFYFSPIKLFEYLAAGRPVVAGAIGQIEELVTDGETALLFEPGRSDRLAATLERLVTDPALGRRIGENGRAWVCRERTWAANAARVVEIARELMSPIEDRAPRPNAHREDSAPPTRADRPAAAATGRRPGGTP